MKAVIPGGLSAKKEKRCIRWRQVYRKSWQLMVTWKQSHAVDNGCVHLYKGHDIVLLIHKTLKSNSNLCVPMSTISVQDDTEL